MLTMEATVTPRVSGLRVLVHRFSWCSCRSETFLADHIKLESFMRPLEPGQAVALSYGIGDFDREKHVFGHVSGLESEPVRLEFGAEWEISDLMNALAALSEKHCAIWFDQLSIPQDPTSIAIHLQNMPQVYRTLEVVILLPNAPCPCLKEALHSWATDGLWTSPDDGDFHIHEVVSRCVNAVPISSYHFRLWTKQEFSYADRISVLYCGAPGGKCSRGVYGVYDRLHPTGRDPAKLLVYLSRWAS